MENWEKRLEIITDGICFRQSDRNNAWWETSEGAEFGQLKLSEIKELFSSELELAKQERTKEILEWIDTQRDADLGDDDIIYISYLVSYLKRSLHQNNNEQGGK
jgi:hypothetical protein